MCRNHNLLESADQDPGVWEGGLVARKFTFNISYLIFKITILLVGA